MKDIVQKAKEWALKEIEINGTPAIEHFELSNQKGQELAKKLGADEDLVMLGTILMDVKLGECFKEGKLSEHVDRSAKASEEFLKNFDIDDELINKIINCVEAHHGTKEFICKEAEICANADCYRFLHPKGIFAYIKLLGKRFDDFEQVISQVEKKMDEKWSILSLDICKTELENYHNSFKQYLKESK